MSATKKTTEEPVEEKSEGGLAEEASESSEGYYEKYLRATADFENFKRRRAQEFVDLNRYSSETAARALLPVLDNLERALEHAPESEDAKPFVDGVRIATRNFVTTLEELGVNPIDAVGQPFDPTIHEAIGGEDSADVEVDTVIAELQRGWRLHDRLLRPAIVRIATPAKGQSTDHEPAEDESGEEESSEDDE
jgi:molecular chaperone GrpE